MQSVMCCLIVKIKYLKREKDKISNYFPTELLTFELAGKTTTYYLDDQIEFFDSLIKELEGKIAVLKFARKA